MFKNNEYLSSSLSEYNDYLRSDDRDYGDEDEEAKEHELDCDWYSYLPCSCGFLDGD